MRQWCTISLIPYMGLRRDPKFLQALDAVRPAWAPEPVPELLGEAGSRTGGTSGVFTPPEFPSEIPREIPAATPLAGRQRGQERHLCGRGGGRPHCHRRQTQVGGGSRRLGRRRRGQYGRRCGRGVGIEAQPAWPGSGAGNQPSFGLIYNLLQTDNQNQNREKDRDRRHTGSHARSGQDRRRQGGERELEGSLRKTRIGGHWLGSGAGNEPTAKHGGNLI